MFRPSRHHLMHCNRLQLDTYRQRHTLIACSFDVSPHNSITLPIYRTLTPFLCIALVRLLPSTGQPPDPSVSSLMKSGINFSRRKVQQSRTSCSSKPTWTFSSSVTGAWQGVKTSGLRAKLKPVMSIFSGSSTSSISFFPEMSFSVLELFSGVSCVAFSDLVPASGVSALDFVPFASFRSASLFEIQLRSL